MTDEHEYRESFESSHDIASAWIVFAALLLGVIAFSAVDFMRSEYAAAIAVSEEQLGTDQIRPGSADGPHEFKE